MTAMTPQYINSKIIILSVIIALLLHASLIIIAKLINISSTDEIEPKIILELLNDVTKETQPIINKIEPTKIMKKEEIIEPPKEIKSEAILNNIIPNTNPDEINIPNDLKSITNNKIDIPRPIKNISPKLNISELPKITKPLPIGKPSKPLKKILAPSLPREKELNNFNKNVITKIQKLQQKPTQYKEKNNVPTKQIKKDLTSSDISDLNNYKNKIRSIIQSFAINNYPQKEKRRKIEGKVHIIFKLRKDGSLEFVKSGPDTNASDALIKSAIESVKKSAPFDKTTLLEQKNEFSITIIYKISR